MNKMIEITKIKKYNKKKKKLIYNRNNSSN